MKLYIYDSGKPTILKVSRLRNALLIYGDGGSWTSAEAAEILRDAQKDGYAYATLISATEADSVVQLLGGAAINAVVTDGDPPAPAVSADEEPQEPEEPEDMTDAVAVALHLMAYSGGNPLIAAARCHTLSDMTSDSETFSDAADILVQVFPFIEAELPREDPQEPQDGVS